MNVLEDQPRDGSLDTRHVDNREKMVDTKEERVNNTDSEYDRLIGA